MLQVSSSSAVVLTWLIALITGGGLISFIIMSITFINYHKACASQNVDRKTRPYYGYFQPYGAWIALIAQVIIVLTYGYYALRPWNIESFFQSYSMQIVAVILFVGWKVFKKTRYIKPHEVDLVWERPQVDDYENSLAGEPVGFWTEVFQLVGYRRNKERVDA